MRVFKYVSIISIAMVIMEGDVMAKSEKNKSSQKWVTFKEVQKGVQVDFPHQPVSLIFDLPYQNTPPTGMLEVISCPTTSGIYLLAILDEPNVTEQSLEPDEFRRLFQDYLISHLFFNPRSFQYHQTFHHASTTYEDFPALSFEFSYDDEDVMKHLEGLAVLKDEKLYCLFSLASDNHFDRKGLKKFLDSATFQLK